MYDNSLYFHCNKLARKLNRIWELGFEKLGISPSHGYLLQLVLTRPGITQHQLVQLLKLEKSTVSRFIDVLTKQGWVTRRKSGRNSVVEATDQARLLEIRLASTMRSLDQQLAEQLGRENMERLVRVIRMTSQKLSDSGL